MRRIAFALLAVLGIGLAVPLIAQESDLAEKSGFLKFVEDRLSTPERQISINGLEGALSSDVKIDEITLSDDEGVWLRIEEAALNWDQGALLTGRLQINSLKAARIVYSRPSVPPGGIQPPDPEATALNVPELPVALFLEALDVPSVMFGAAVFGLEAEVSLTGRLVLEGGSLDTNLSIVRQDGPGGALDAAVTYARASNELDLDVTLREPQNGVLANVLELEGRPDISLQIRGSGPVDDLTAELNFSAGGSEVLSGTTILARRDGGLGINADLGGPLADLMPLAYQRFFGEQTRLVAEALILDAGGFRLDRFSLAGGQILVTGTAQTSVDGFLNQLQLDARVSAAAGESVLLPVAGQATQVDAATVLIDFGDNNERWTGTIDIAGFAQDGFGADNVRLDLSGAALNLADAATRRVTLNADGEISGITSTDPQIEDALGSSIGIGVAGLWNAGQPIKIVEARVVGKALEVALRGDVDDFVFDGGVAIVTPSLAPFSGIADRQLTGAIDLAATGTFSLLGGGFDLELDGLATSLGIGVDAADKVLAGRTDLSGRIARSSAGIVAEQLRLTNAQATILADGRIASTEADFGFNIVLSDLGLLSDAASGAVAISGTARGGGDDGAPIDIRFDAETPQGTLVDRQLRDAKLTLAGSLTDGDFVADLTGEAFLDGFKISLQSELVRAGDINRLSDLEFVAGGTTVRGEVLQDDDGLLTGSLDLEATDLSLAAALLLLEASGSATASVALSGVDGAQALKATGQVRDISIDATKVGSGSLDVSIADLFGVPEIDGFVDARAISAAGLDIASLSARAQHRGEQTDFSVQSALESGTDLTLAGDLTPVASGYRLGINEVELVDASLRAALVAPTQLTLIDETISIAPAVFDVGGGRITVSGTSGEMLDLDVGISALPLAIANGVMPALGLGGILEGRLDIGGTAADPEVDFDVSGRGLDAQMLAGLGVSPLAAEARGSYRNERVELQALDVEGPAGLLVRASGQMPLVGSNGNISVTGSVPLALANRSLGQRGAQASGVAVINASVTGSLGEPAYGGTVSLSGAEIVDPQSNLRLQSIEARASLNRDRMVIEAFSGSLATGGSISASGTIGLNGDLPADIQVRLNSARYADGNLFVATGSGDLAITGALLRGPLLSGNVVLEKAEISVPDLAGPEAVLVDVDHVALPQDVAATLRRIERDGENGGGGGSSSVLRLDLSISAPNQIFVRGRGIDAELGGSVRLTGTVSNIQPVGGFELIRGRMTILGQRIVFDSGRVTLVGDLDPFIRFAASSAAEGTTVFVIVEGPVSDLDVVFTSDPELPQDEVLSLLIFQRALGDLSPLQLLRLAAAAAELAGEGNDSITESIRSATGLDDLDVVTDADGNVAVRAGQYIQENVYVNVEAGAQGQGKVSIDLDLTDDLKARGSATSDGETSIGIFFEQDY